MGRLPTTLFSFLFCFGSFFSYADGAPKAPEKDGVYYECPIGVDFWTFNFFTNTPVHRKQSCHKLKFYLPNTIAIKDTSSNKSYYEVVFYTISNDDYQVGKITGDGFEKLKGSQDYINSADNGTRFVIEASVLDKLITDRNIEKYFFKFIPKFITGASISTPFKFRPEIGDRNYTFSPELSLGPYAGLNMRLDKTNPIFLNWIASAGISSISINDNSEIVKDGKDGLALGFFVSTGIVLQVSDFQIGGLIGGDFVSGEMGKNWVYNEHMWWSFSIGYNFLGGATKEDKKARKDDEALKQDLKENSLQSVAAILQKNGGQYTKTHADGSKEILVVNTITAAATEVAKLPLNAGKEAKDFVVNIQPVQIAQAKLLDTTINSNLETWVYIGQKVNGILATHFNITTVPHKDDTVQAKDAVYKRKSVPIESKNGDWTLGEVKGVVRDGESVTILEVREIKDQNFWAKVK
jgi:hypothetical protein